MTEILSLNAERALAAEKAATEAAIQPAAELATPEATPEPDRYHKKASSMGWKPLEEYQGDPEDWVDAREYILREPLFKSNKKLRAELNQMRKTVEDMADHVKKAHTSAFKRLEKQYIEQREAAIKAGNPAEVRRFEEELKDVYQAHQEAEEKLTVAPAPNIEFQEWAEENKWFDVEREPEMAGVADGLYRSYVARNPDADISTTLKHVTKEVKKLYPDKFTTNKATSKEVDEDEHEPAPRVAAGSRGTGGRRSTYKDMNSEQKKVCDRFVGMGVFKTRQEYVDQLIEIGEL